MEAALLGRKNGTKKKRDTGIAKQILIQKFTDWIGDKKRMDCEYHNPSAFVEGG